MLTRSRKAFTLLELIVVIVILGILAALALPTFDAVITRARQENANAAAKSFDRELRALAAFDEDAPSNHIAAAATDATAGGVTVSPSTNGASEVTVTAGGGTACLTLGTTASSVGSVADGSC